MPEHPEQAIVTVMFTDLEGSTGLVTRLGDEAARDLFAEHDRLVGEELRRHGGRSIRDTGDGFLALFNSGRRALGCAVAIQRALEERNARRPGSALAVRIGLNAGEVVITDDGVRGAALHAAARVMALAHGGEILVTDAVREIAAAGPDMVFRDRGWVTLRGFPERRRLHEVLWKAQDSASPAVTPAPGLPVGRGHVVGRESDIAAVTDLVRDPEVSLVTIVGPGGVGKTRLAAELSLRLDAEFADGATFVALAPVQHHGDVATAILQAIGVERLPGEAVEAALGRHLATRQVLLVLDNFEHVMPAAPLVSALLTASSASTVLVTSREPLRLLAEQVFPLAPLAVPAAGGDPDAETLGRVPAVALFTSAARARHPGFAVDAANGPAVATVCRRLDGLPLALELAAGRLAVLSPHELAHVLDKGSLALGKGPRDAPARHQTLRATLEWSHELLDLDEQRTFAALSVFVGGATAPAAMAVAQCDLDVLESLVDKNLIVSRPAEAGRRLSMLETVRTYARERLEESGGEDDVRGRHFEWMLALAEAEEPQIRRSGSVDGIARLAADSDNLTSALRFALGAGDGAGALRLAMALVPYWEREESPRAEEFLRAVTPLALDARHDALRARAWSHLATELARVPTFAKAHAAADAGLACATAAGNLVAMAYARCALSEVAIFEHGTHEAFAHAVEAEALAQSSGEPELVARAVGLKAMAAPSPDVLREATDDAAGLLRQLGDTTRLGQLLMNTTYTAVFLEADDDARRLINEAAAYVEPHSTGRRWAVLSGNWGLVCLMHGDLDEAATHFHDEIDAALELGRAAMLESLVYEGLHGLAAVAAGRQRDEVAARLLGAADALDCDKHDPVVATRIERRFFHAARRRLTDGPWHQALAAGHRLGREEALALARTTVSSSPQQSGVS